MTIYLVKTIPTGPFQKGKTGTPEYYILNSNFSNNFVNEDGSFTFSLPNVNDRNGANSNLEIKCSIVSQTTGALNDPSESLTCSALNELQIRVGQPTDFIFSNGKILAVKMINGTDENTGSSLFYCAQTENRGNYKIETYTVNQTLTQIINNFYL